MTTIPVFIAWILFSPSPTQADEALIRAVVAKSYLGGMYIGRDLDSLRRGFHERFRMAVFWQGEFSERDRETWIQKFTSYPAPDKEKAASYRWNIPTVLVAGFAAAARIEIYQHNQLKYTDFFTFYRFPEGWRVLEKTFHYHPNERENEYDLDSDRKAIESLIDDAYIGGHLTGHDPKALRKGFHERFRMIVWHNGELDIRDREAWIGRVMSHPAPTPEAAASWRWQIPVIELAGDAGLAQIEVYKRDHHIFTDFLTFYRFPEGWRAVGKIFNYAPEP